MTERLTPALLRMHANAKTTVGWRGQAKRLLRWSADVLEAAEIVINEGAESGGSHRAGQATRLNVRKALPKKATRSATQRTKEK